MGPSHLEAVPRPEDHYPFPLSFPLRIAALLSKRGRGLQARLYRQQYRALLKLRPNSRPP